MGKYGFRRACSATLVALAAACSGDAPTSPAPVPAGSGVSALTIAGLPAALSPGSATQLRAEVVSSTGTVKECAAAWSVDDAKVASISPSGLLTAGITGYVNVTAVCEGLTRRAETKVEGTNPYRLVIVAYDSEVPSEFGVAATMEFLDGPRAGQKITTGGIFAAGVTDVTWPVRVRFTADGYQTKEFVLAESTGSRRNPISNLFDFAVPMTFAPNPLTDTYVRTMSRTESEIRHPFTLGAPGPVQIRTWWSVDYNDRLTIEVWCGDRMLRSTVQQAGSAGAGFTHEVQTAGACEVRLRQIMAAATIHYRIAIRYPR